MSAIDEDDDPLTPARGVVNGVIDGSILWLLLFALLWLVGCTMTDKAYPLDCYPRCIDRLD